MYPAIYAQLHQKVTGRTAILKKQLYREINCLERQLERLRLRNDVLDLTTRQTYEEMISSRKDIVENLP